MKRTMALLMCLLLLAGMAPAFALTYDELLQKAAMYEAAGDYDKAFASYQLAVCVDANAPQAHVAEGLLRLKLGQAAEAILCADAALGIDPTLQHAWVLRCRADAVLGDVEAAENDMLMADICEADMSDCVTDLAMMYSANGQPEKAAEWFAKAAFDTLDDAQRTAYLRALVAAGRRDQAVALGLCRETVRNEKLDAAFDDDRLVLVETQTLPAEISPSDFVFTQALLDSANVGMTVEEYEAQLKEREAFCLRTEVVSLSPTGKSGILVADGTVASFYEEKYHILYPAYDKGVEDEYGNLEYVFERFVKSGNIETLIGKEGVRYSPDSRYAVILNEQMTVEKMNFVLDPILIDLSTGEMILTETGARKITKGSAITTGTFSADGRYFYYLLYGKFADCDSYTRLMRYDLTEQKTEVCRINPDWMWTYLPQLAEVEDGSLLVLNDTNKTPLPAGIIRYWQEADGKWTFERRDLPVPSKEYLPRQMSYSANSGYMLTSGRVGQLDKVLLQVITPENEWNGLDRFIALSKESNEVEVFAAEELMNRLIEEATVNVQNGTVLVPYQAHFNVTMSPDGHYALIAAYNNGEVHLFMLRLEDLVVREVKGVDSNMIHLGEWASGSRQCVEWNGETLLIRTKEGMRNYRFE